MAKEEAFQIIDVERNTMFYFFYFFVFLFQRIIDPISHMKKHVIFLSFVFLYFCRIFRCFCFIILLEFSCNYSVSSTCHYMNTYLDCDTSPPLVMLSVQRLNFVIFCSPIWQTPQLHTCQTCRNAIKLEQENPN